MAQKGPKRPKRAQKGPEGPKRAQTGEKGPKMPGIKAYQELCDLSKAFQEFLGCFTMFPMESLRLCIVAAFDSPN